MPTNHASGMAAARAANVNADGGCSAPTSIKMPKMNAREVSSTRINPRVCAANVLGSGGGFVVSGKTAVAMEKSDRAHTR